MLNASAAQPGPGLRARIPYPQPITTRESSRCLGRANLLRVICDRPILGGNKCAVETHPAARLSESRGSSWGGSELPATQYDGLFA